MSLIGLVAKSAVGSRVGIFSNFFVGNNLLLELFRTFSFALNNNPKLFNFFLITLLPLSKFFILAAKFLCPSSASFNDKCPSCMSLKKQ